MKRKVVQQGPATLMVSLPSKWVKKYNIKKGKELELDEQDGKIVISIEKVPEFYKTTIDTKKLGKFNKNLISAAYQVGYDEVEVLFDDVRILKQIQERLSDLIGFEIVDHGEHHCTIRSISLISDMEFDKVLKRIFLMLISMANDSLDAIERKEFDRLKEIREMEATNNKLTDFCRRVLTKIGYVDSKKTIIMYSLVHDIEKIADDYKHICDYFYENKRPVGKDVLEIYKEVNDYLKTFYGLFYKSDAKKNERMLDEGKTITNSAYELLKKKSVDEQILLHHLINLTTKIYELTLPFFQMNI